MPLNHVNLCASDVPGLADTLVRHFGYVLAESGSVPGGGEFAVVVGADDSELVITPIDPPAPGTSAYPAGFHVGLIQDSAEAVRAKHHDLGAAGLDPKELNEFEAWGATWTAFYCPVGPDGLEIEINHHTPSALLDGAADRARRG